MQYLKNTFIITLLLIGGLYNANCQTEDQLHEEFSKIDRDYSDNVETGAFISPSFFMNHKLYGGDTTNSRKRVWSSDNADYNQVYDIRWKFSSEKEALDFYNKFLIINSENSVELKKIKIEIEGTAQLNVFEDLNSEEMMKAFGFKSKNYCFLMVVNNYVIKLYISAEDYIEVSDAKIFAVEAVARTLNVSQ